MTDGAESGAGVAGPEGEEVVVLVVEVTEVGGCGPISTSL